MKRNTWLAAEVRPDILGECMAADIGSDRYFLGGIGHRVDSVLTTHLWRECSKPDVLGVGVVYPD